MGKEIGIDFGTSNTVVSYHNKDGYLRQLKYKGDDVIPSVVYYLSRDECIIGKHAKKMMESKKNGAGVANFKSTLGDNDFKHEIIAENGDTFFLRSREVAKDFLNELAKGIEEKLLKEFGPVDGCLERAVITVPATFDPEEKKATKRAAREALSLNIGDVRLAGEPTAAAIAYEDDVGLDGPEDVLMVYDFGGGTFDVSIIQKGEQGAFREITTNGDPELGGNRLTQRLTEELLERVNDAYGMNMPWDKDEFSEELSGISFVDYQKNMDAIRLAANVIKEDLSSEEEVRELINIIIPGGKSVDYEAVVDRTDLEGCIAEEIQRTVDIAQNVISEAKAEGVEGINRIILAGGSSNIPMVKNLLEETLDEQDIVFCDNVDTLISRGAAVLADKWDLATPSKTNAQLGVVANEGVAFAKFQPIIMENMDLPVSGKSQFSLDKSGLKELVISLYKRDIKNFPAASRPGDDGIKEMGRLVIRDLPDNLKSSDTKIEIEVTVEADGGLAVAAELLGTDGRSLGRGQMKVAMESDVE